MYKGRFPSLNFFVIEDQAVAEKFKIDTTKPGDLILIKQNDTAFRSRTGKQYTQSFTICGFPFTSEVLMPASYAKDKEKCAQGVFSLLVSQPLFFQDFFERNQNIFENFYYANMLFIYCDPKLHGQDTYD
jgi:hypothetical protein